MDKYKDKAKSVGVKLIWVNKPLLNGGYNIAGEFKGFHTGVIFIQSDLSSSEIDYVFNHELGQLLDGSPITKLSSTMLHSQSEARANEYMIHQKVIEWLKTFEGNYDTGLYPERFLRWAGLDIRKFYYVAEKEIKEVISAI
ncbi:hypothetical protein ACJQWY_02415 [Weissella kandleri]|uniref:hypothetical protein n=1 Tax=Weissella kandleri TaxID=1616 RepID=UPI00387E4F7D